MVIEIDQYQLLDTLLILEKIGEWKIQLIMKINFISSRDFIESRDMYSKSDNFEIMRGSNTNEIIRDLFNSILRRY